MISGIQYGFMEKTLLTEACCGLSSKQAIAFSASRNEARDCKGLFSKEVNINGI